MMTIASEAGRVEVEPSNVGVVVRFYGPRDGYLGATSLPLGNGAALARLIEEAEERCYERMAEAEAAELTAVPELGTH